MDRIGPGLAYRERAAGFYDGSTERKALAFGGRQKVGLEFHGEDVGTSRHQRECGDAAGTVESCGDDAGMNEAVLLGQLGRIGHRQVDLARLHARDRDAERVHRALPFERIGRDRSKFRIPWLKMRHASARALIDTVAYHGYERVAIRHRIGEQREARMTDGKGDSWIEAGFAELARSGVEGVRVEVLAKDLGVTKGGFYRRFRDRAALLDAMLQSWRDGRIAAIEKQTSLDGATARERLKALIQLYSERMNTAGHGDRTGDPAMGALRRSRSRAVASVDAARLKNVGHLYRATGLPAEQADAQAFLFYCFIFGQSLLFLERGPRKRAQTRSAES